MNTASVLLSLGKGGREATSRVEKKDFPLTTASIL